MPIIRSFCNKVLWLDQGQVRMLGSVDDVLLAYEGAVLS
jgi:ABC-type polysaccharide/polyol phosphate transport system ATPase subunit